MKPAILLLVVSLAFSGVQAQTSKLPLTLKNVTHSYPNLNVVTTTPGAVIYDQVQLTARDVAFNNTPVNLIKGSITAGDITFSDATSIVNINSTNIKATGDVTIHSTQLSLTTVVLKAQTISFTNGTVTIRVKGNVKFICDEINFGSGAITINRDPSGGSLTIECKSSIGTGNITYVDNPNVKFVTK